MAEQHLRGEDGRAQTLEGRVESAVIDGGSRSEHTGPVLRLETGECLRIYRVGDHPFDNATLLGLEGRAVRLEGQWRSGVLRVQDTGLTVLDDGPPPTESDDG